MPDYLTGTNLKAYIPGVDAAAFVHKGGQKAVYKATIEGQVVALKVVALGSKRAVSEEQAANMHATVARAQREVDILEQVDVPVLARRGPLDLSILTIGENLWLYFTEEWIEGRTLQAMIRECRLSPQQVARVGVDLVQAVCWLSNRSLVHRDIKPANVMLASDRSRFVLLDPGIALDLYGTSITQVPAPVGTMAYLSPEQMDPSRKRSLDFRSDLFAIGVVLYESAVTEHPFRTSDSTLYQVLSGILTQTPRPVAERIEDFPQNLSTFISRLLGKAPHLRFRTCDRALKTIEEIAAALGTRA